MDTLSIVLYLVSMSYFDGIEFLLWDDIPAYDSMVDQRFRGYYALQFNYSGRLAYAIDGRRMRTLDGPCAWVTGPGHRYRYGAPAGDTRHHMFVAFIGRRTKCWQAGGLLHLTSRPVRIADPERFRETFKELHDAVGPSRRWAVLHPVRPISLTDIPASATVVNAQRATNRLETLLLEMIHQPQVSTDPPVDNRFKALARRIKEQPIRAWSYESEAQALGLSPTHFRRRFLAVNRVPMGRFVRQSRLEWAAWQLRATDTPIKSIAEKVGATDVYHFTRMFSQCFQSPPGRYRGIFQSHGSRDRAAENQ